MLAILPKDTYSFSKSRLSLLYFKFDKDTPSILINRLKISTNLKKYT